MPFGNQTYSVEICQGQHEPAQENVDGNLAEDCRSFVETKVSVFRSGEANKWSPSGADSPKVAASVPIRGRSHFF